MDTNNEKMFADYVELVKSYQDIDNLTISKPISQAIQDYVEQNLIFRNVCDIDYEPRLDEDKTHALWDVPLDPPVWTLPGLGFVAQDRFELENVPVAVFPVQVARDWKLSYMENRVVEIIKEASLATARQLTDYMEEAGWRTLIPAVTSKFGGAGILPPDMAQIYEMPTGDATAGYFSKELLNRIIVGAESRGKRINLVWISPEDMADIREWTEADVDPITRREILQVGGMGSIWDINLVAQPSLGIKGKYNINGNASEWGPLKVNIEGAYNDYVVAHPNILDENGILQTPGETQFYAFTEDIKSTFKMPVSEKYIARWDLNLLRRQRVGFYGWMRFGSALMGHSSVSMGIVDRSMEDIQVEAQGYMRIKPKRQYVPPSHRS